MSGCNGTNGTQDYPDFSKADADAITGVHTPRAIRIRTEKAANNQGAPPEMTTGTNLEASPDTPSEDGNRISGIQEQTQANLVVTLPNNIAQSSQ